MARTNSLLTCIQQSAWEKFYNPGTWTNVIHGFLTSRDFGNKIIQIKPMVKYLPKLIEDRDKNVREETKQLIVEIYRWIGAAIKPKLADLKPVQVGTS